jgi:elongation factor Tu
LKALEGDPEWEKTIDELMAVVDSYIKTQARAIEKPFLMPVDDIFTIQGRGTIVTGRIERGRVKINDPVEIVGLRPTRNTVVTGVEMFKKLLDEGVVGDNVGLLLGGIDRNDIERGQVIAKPRSIGTHRKFMAEVKMWTKEQGGRHTPVFSGYQPQFYFHSTEVTGEARWSEGKEMVVPGDEAAMEIELITTIAIEKWQRFLIREGGRTVGIGFVTDIVD